MLVGALVVTDGAVYAITGAATKGLQSSTSKSQRLTLADTVLIAFLAVISISQTATFL
jgi:hypothetical protein